MEVRAPFWIPKSEIDCFVLSKKHWIDKHLSNYKEVLKKKSEFCLNYGGTLSLQGRPYKITAEKDGLTGFCGECFYLPPHLLPDEIKRAVIYEYKRAAKEIIIEKVSFYSKIVGMAPEKISINSAKTRWGSCSSKNRLNFSWRLVMAEDQLIDYVVVHELAHIIEHNHSYKFWAIVKDIIPDYKERQMKLKGLEKILHQENWE